MSIVDLLKEKIERQLAALDEQLAAAEAEAKAKKAQAEADVAGAELEQELLARVNDLKGKLADGRAYLQELADAGEEKADQLRDRIAGFLD